MVDVPLEKTAHTTLRKSYLSFFEIIAQSFGTVAPSAVPGLMLPAIFTIAGNGSYFVIAFVGIGVIFLGQQIRVFACRMASPGALYVYTAEGLGPFAGVIGGWSDLVAYLIGGGAALVGLSNVFAYLLLQVFGIHDLLTVKIVILLSFGSLAAWLAYRDIKVSTRTTFFVEFVTVALVLFVIGFHFVKKGSVIDHAQLKLEGFTFEQFRLALVLAFFAFPGFETASVLGAEAQQPLRTIPRAIFVSTLLLTGFFVFSVYGLVDAFHNITPPLDKQDAPLTALAQSFGYKSMGLLLAAGVCSSIFAALLGCFNASSRVLYSLSHRGLLNRHIGRVHAKNATPHIAIGASLAIILISTIPLTLMGIAPMDIFAYLGTLSSFGFLTSYILVSIGAAVYLNRLKKLKATNLVTTIIATLVLIVPIIGSLYPVPDWPLNILPYIFFSFSVVGSLYYFFIRAKDPQRLKSMEEEFIFADNENK